MLLCILFLDLFIAINFEIIFKQITFYCQKLGYYPLFTQIGLFALIIHCCFTKLNHFCFKMSMSKWVSHAWHEIYSYDKFCPSVESYLSETTEWDTHHPSSIFIDVGGIFVFWRHTWVSKDNICQSTLSLIYIHT